MTLRQAVLSVGLWLTMVATAAAQRPWVEAKGPHVTVVSDAGAARARDIAWQFEQVREAITQVFPWVRVDGARPLVVLAARNEVSMRGLAPQYWEGGSDGSRVASVSRFGQDRSYIAVRADARIEDREGINPYQAAYWSFSAQALRETSGALPAWLVRGMASVMSNILVRDKEIQVGRTLPQHLETLRTRPRLSLREVVSVVASDDKRLDDRDFMAAFDAHAWAFAHFLVWNDRGANGPLFDRYVSGVVGGADPQASLTSTLGDVARFETAFNTYVNRDVFAYVAVGTAAKLSREGFATRDLPPVESALLRGALLASMSRPAEARALVEEARTAQGAGVGDEVLALVADYGGDDVALKAALEKAVTQPHSTWYSPFRLATLLPRAQDPSALERIEALLTQATTLNPLADGAWAFLGEVKAALGRGEAALAPVEKAVAMVPGSSANHISRARVLMRLGRNEAALRDAGVGRALAKTPAERAVAQGVLAELAKAAGATAEAAAPAASTPPVAARSDAGPDVGDLIDTCSADKTRCAEVLPVIIADCDAAATRASAVACRFSGLVLDEGLGVPADPARAAAFYTKGCQRADPPSCWRYATLQALGRGVTKDVPAAMKVLDSACTAVGREACLRLGFVLATNGTAPDLARARTVLKTSCDGGFEPSCQLLKQLPQ